jgi:hypothetical protein|tara:strand:+ start:214 stop:507 length:294 start_codon:yes stop_codon:yes gene_type:complete
MLNFKFKKKLVSTKELVEDIGLSLSWLDLQKTKWRKKGKDDWDMGLRLIGTKAFWDPVIFTKWLFEHKCKNKPTNNTEQLETKALITFVRKNTKYET